MIPRYKPKSKRKGKNEKPIIQVTYWPGREFYLLHEGPDQSEIRWIQGGKTIIICNEFIVKGEES
jgi:hypothetical protein